MPQFEKFSTGTEGLTRVEELERYGTSDLYLKGWSAVGIVSAEKGEGDDKEVKLYGVYHMVTDDALRAAQERLSEKEKEISELRSEKNALDKKQKETAEFLLEAQRNNAALSAEIGALRSKLEKTQPEGEEVDPQ